MINKFKADGAIRSFLLYDGEIKLTFKESGHRYEVDGQEVVGVTTILKTVIAKEALINWAVKMTTDHIVANFNHGAPYSAESLLKLCDEAKKAHRLVKEGSADVGLRAHKWIEEYIKSKISKTEQPEPPLDPDLKEPIQAFLLWEQGNNVEWLESELPVYSRKYNFCGTMDFLARVNGKVIVGDIKTSNAIYPESYYLQVAAYRYAYEEEHPDAKIDGMTIIRIPKDKKSQLEVRQVNDYQDNATAFVYAVHLYKQITKLKNFNK